jgi:hypothetical protein
MANDLSSTTSPSSPPGIEQLTGTAPAAPKRGRGRPRKETPVAAAPAAAPAAKSGTPKQEAIQTIASRQNGQAKINREIAELIDPSLAVRKQPKYFHEPDEGDEPSAPETAAAEVEREAPAAKPAATKPEPAAKPAEKSDIWPQYLLDALEETGFSQDDFASPKAAHKFLTVAQRRESPRAAEPEAKKEPPKQFDPFEGIDRKEFADVLGEGPANKLFSLIENINKHYADKFGQHEEYVGYLSQQAEQTREDRVDAMFESINDEFDGVFGEGSLRDLAAGSAEATARMNAWEWAMDIAAKRGVRMSKSLLKRGAKLALDGMKPKQPTKSESADDGEASVPEVIRKRQGQFLGTGSQTNGRSTLGPRAEALQAIKRYTH